MFNIKKVFPLGLATLAMASFVGMKDAGVFLNPHQTVTYSGKKIEFKVGERVSIKETKGSSFIVAKGEARLNVPKEKILLTETNIKLFRVVKNTGIKNNGKTVRNLFLGEELRLLEDKDATALVIAEDGVKGLVSKSSLEAISNSQRFVTSTEAKKDFSLKDGQKTILFKKGDRLDVVDFVDGLFVILKDGNEYRVAGDCVSLNSLPNNVSSNEAAEMAEAGIEVVPEEFRNKLGTVERPSFVADNSKVSNIISSALDKLGTPYVYATAGPESYDCSGFVYAVYTNEFGIKLPRSSRDQSEVGIKIEKEDLAAGDLVFFDTLSRGYVSHVGIYIGNGEFVHASSGQGRVIVSKLDQGYYSTRYVSASRVIK